MTDKTTIILSLKFLIGMYLYENNRNKYQNFRCFSDITINIDPKLTVFVGKNASGKTSILDACSFLLKYLILNFTGKYKTSLKAIDIKYNTIHAIFKYILLNKNNHALTVNLDYYNDLNNKESLKFDQIYNAFKKNF
ncbi:MAG: AAA family ATPase [Desulfovibrionaceae bacterium]|nr:AAA family ATPase [Desulfovibrionaceae bacterium]